jgi:hypothetical protein
MPEVRSLCLSSLLYSRSIPFDGDHPSGRSRPPVKNWLFAENDAGGVRAASLYTLIASANAGGRLDACCRHQMNHGRESWRDTPAHRAPSSTTRPGRLDRSGEEPQARDRAVRSTLAATEGDLLKCAPHHVERNALAVPVVDQLPVERRQQKRGAAKAHKGLFDRRAVGISTPGAGGAGGPPTSTSRSRFRLAVVDVSAECRRQRAWSPRVPSALGIGTHSVQAGRSRVEPGAHAEI